MDNLPGAPYSESDSLMSMFQIDLDNYMKIKFAFMYHMHLPGSELELWPYWEYEMHLETLHDVIQKKQQAERKSSKDMESMNPASSASSLMKQASSSMPKPPSMPSPSSFKMPR